MRAPQRNSILERLPQVSIVEKAPWLSGDKFSRKNRVASVHHAAIVKSNVEPTWFGQACNDPSKFGARRAVKYATQSTCHEHAVELVDACKA